MESKLKNIKFPKEMLKKIRQESEKLRISDSAYIRIAISKQLEAQLE